VKSTAFGSRRNRAPAIRGVDVHVVLSQLSQKAGAGRATAELAPCEQSISEYAQGTRGRGLRRVTGRDPCAGRVHMEVGAVGRAGTAGTASVLACRGSPPCCHGAGVETPSTHWRSCPRALWESSFALHSWSKSVDAVSHSRVCASHR
jgi:hypothetical protein